MYNYVVKRGPIDTMLDPLVRTNPKGKCLYNSKESNVYYVLSRYYMDKITYGRE